MGPQFCPSAGRGDWFVSADSWVDALPAVILQMRGQVRAQRKPVHPSVRIAISSPEAAFRRPWSSTARRWRSFCLVAEVAMLDRTVKPQVTVSIRRCGCQETKPNDLPASLRKSSTGRKESVPPGRDKFEQPSSYNPLSVSFKEFPWPSRKPTRSGTRGS